MVPPGPVTGFPLPFFFYVLQILTFVTYNVDGLHCRHDVSVNKQAIYGTVIPAITWYPTLYTAPHSSYNNSHHERTGNFKPHDTMCFLGGRNQILEPYF
jgi:hypothetical protein